MSLPSFSSGTVLLSHFCFRKKLTSVAFACIVFQHLIHSYWESSFLFKCRDAIFKFMPICRYRFLRPLLTASVLPWHARRLLRRVLPRKGQGFFPVVAIQLSVRFTIGSRARARCISFLAAARSAVPICRPGHQYRGQNKSRFRLEAAHLVQKTKCADLNMKSAAVGRFFAHCNRKSLAAANTQSRFFRE